MSEDTFVDVVLLTWDDWEALYIDGGRAASGHRGSIKKVKELEGKGIKSYREERVFPKGGAYPNKLSEVNE